MFLSVEAGALLRVEKLLEDPVGRVHRLVNVLLGKKILLKTRERRKRDGKSDKETFRDREKGRCLRLPLSLGTPRRPGWQSSPFG